MLSVGGGAEQADSPDSLMPAQRTAEQAAASSNEEPNKCAETTTTTTSSSSSTSSSTTTTTTTISTSGEKSDRRPTSKNPFTLDQFYPGTAQYVPNDTYQPPVNVMAVNGVSVSAPPGVVHNPSLELAVISPGNSTLVSSADSKDGIEELCPVCGDKVSGYHYGLLTCESCKGFFKRTVQNKKVYQCVAERSCHIDKSQRKRCPFCRFQKCLDVGMKLEAVRADRMRGGRNKFGPMYKRDRAKKLQMLRQKQLALQCGDSMSQSTLVAITANPYSIPTASVSSPGMYDTNGGVKQEIQIPQLSSSTSSPESSPSPLQTTLSSLSITTTAISSLLDKSLRRPSAQVTPLNQQGHFETPKASAPNGGNNNNNITSNNNNNNNNSNSTNNNNNNSSNNNNNNNSNNNWASQVATAASGRQNIVPFQSFEGGLSSSQSPLPLVLTSQSQQSPQSKVPSLVRELQKNMMDARGWQSEIFLVLQSQTYNQVEVDLFELMCKVIDRELFVQVDWARSTIYFKELRVDDQMKLLQQSWSDMLVLDHIHQRMHNNLPDEARLPNGQYFDLVSPCLMGMPSLADQLHAITQKLTDLRFDPVDFACLKFLMLFNADPSSPEVRALANSRLVTEAQEQTKQVLLEYCTSNYPNITDKFSQLMAILPEIKAMSLRGEEFLYFKHVNGNAPTQTLLMEMLHARRRP